MSLTISGIFEILIDSPFFALPSTVVDVVVVVEHFAAEDEFVVIVNFELVFAVEETTLFSSLLGDDRCEVDVDEVDGGWCSLSMPLSC